MAENNSKKPGKTQASPEGSAAPAIGVWARIKDHKIAQWALAYAAGAYALLDGTKILSEAFDWPHWLLRAVAALLVLGLPLMVTLAWYHGHRALRRVSGAELSIITVLLVLASGVLWRLARAPEVASSHPAATPPAASAGAAFSPPAHSVAVLPFVNMSGDKEQEYFSEGLTEEVLNSLARLDELQVAARTSSFSFQGEHPDISTVAHKLNVGAVLEGSVRRAGHTVRITTQLVNGVTGFHMWSQTYDRDLRDVLKLQTEIAQAVAAALKVTLLGDIRAKIEAGGTRNPAAFDAYLNATKGFREYQNRKDLEGVIAGYTTAIRLDSRYGLAYAGRSSALAVMATDYSKGPAIVEYLAKARADADKSIALAPELAEGHMALAGIYTNSLEFRRGRQEYERALTLAPGSAEILSEYGWAAVLLGYTDAGLSAAHRAVELDPLNPQVRGRLGDTLNNAQRYRESIAVLRDARALAPADGGIQWFLGIAQYGSGDLQGARTTCEVLSDDFQKEFCLALVYEKMGRHADAESMLATFRESWGEDFSVFYALIYAAWGDAGHALDSLDIAMRRRNAYLLLVRAHPYFNSIYQEPRFQVILKALKFPD